MKNKNWITERLNYTSNNIAKKYYHSSLFF